MEKNVAKMRVLITGAAKRVGASMARYLHACGMDILIHYRDSVSEAESLCAELCAERLDSARCIRADLADPQAVEELAGKAWELMGGIDALVNNASVFYPMDVHRCTVAQWNRIMQINLTAPMFLARALASRSPAVQAIVNITDVHGERPLPKHVPYSVSKAGLVMLTRALAQELAPHTRVNAIAPGAISWKEGEESDKGKHERILRKIPLGRKGRYQDIAKAVHFLLSDAPYMTGQIISVDGGRSISDAETPVI
ncbi:MAG: pteridine reductase [Candidatus Eutrophobiaceae bacterium]